MYPLFIQHCLFSADKCSINPFLRSLLSKCCFPSPLKRSSILERYTTTASTAKRLRCNYLKFSIPPKAKEVHFKTMNEIYPCKELLCLKFNADVNECTFCENNIETQEHLFFSCNVSDRFWKVLYQWLLENNLSLSPLSDENIQFGVALEDKKTEFLLNSIMILAKHYIHKCKFMSVTPYFQVMLKELAIF